MKIIIIIVIIIVGFYRQLLFQEPSKVIFIVVHSVVVVSFDIFELMKIILFIEIGLNISLSHSLIEACCVTFAALKILQYFVAATIMLSTITALVEKCPQLAENGK